jgi:hypothetical protein
MKEQDIYQKQCPTSSTAQCGSTSRPTHRVAAVGRGYLYIVHFKPWLSFQLSVPLSIGQCLQS